jgi:tripartite-type tricarboxylate transporter receptor subunit TctC
VPAAVTDKLRASIAGVLAQPEVRQKFEAHASEVVANSPEEFTRYLAAELSRWKKIAADANIRAE